MKKLNFIIMNMKKLNRNEDFYPFFSIFIILYLLLSFFSIFIMTFYISFIYIYFLFSFVNRIIILITFVFNIIFHVFIGL